MQGNRGEVLLPPLCTDRLSVLETMYRVPVCQVVLKVYSKVTEPQPA